jgi:hypothetical protein
MSEKIHRQFEASDDEITIADLYPNLTPNEQAEAEYRMLRYLAVVKEIFERIVEGKTKLLTELERRAMLRREKHGKR